MALLSNKSVRMSGGLAPRTITQTKTKLYGLQVAAGYAYDASGGPTHATDYVDGFTVSLLDGGPSGDALFKFTIPVGVGGFWSGQIPFNIMFGSNYILFNNGLFAGPVGGTTETSTQIKKDNVRLSFIYEVG